MDLTSGIDYYRQHGAEQLKKLISSNPSYKCTNCTVTMGTGWIGSHHVGAKMTCGKCSGNNFHPGMNDAGFELFNNIINGRSACTGMTTASVSTTASMSPYQEQYNIDQNRQYFEANRLKILQQMGQMEQVGQELNHIKSHTDSIMAHIRIAHGYMFTFSYGDLISIQYGLIPLKAVTTSFLCFKIKYSDPDDLAKLLFKATKDNHMYTHDNLDSLVDYMSKNTTGNCKGVLVYKAGRYGLINF